MRTTAIPVTVGTLEARGHHEERKSDDCYKDRGFEAPKRRQVTRIARVPATVSTFEACLGGVGGGWELTALPISAPGGSQPSLEFLKNYG